MSLVIPPTKPSSSRIELRLKSPQTFADDIALFGRTVPPRGATPKRTHGDKEDFCLRRWLAAMQAAGALKLPLTVQGLADGRPDFILVWDDVPATLGVEVTEAGEATWQQWLTRTARSETRSGEVNFQLPRRVYVGDDPERIVVDDIARAIRGKIEKAAPGRYADTAECDLLIYENSEGGFCARQEEVVATLRHSASQAGLCPQKAFRQIHLVFGDIVHLDLFGDEWQPVDVSLRYAEDWVGWLRAQAKFVRQRKPDEIDFDNLAEELESLSKSEQRALISQLQRLMVHLLKWQHQPERRSKSWRLSIFDARIKAEELLAESPSLEPLLPELVAKAYQRARRTAAIQADLPIDRFLETSPYTVDHLFDTDFLPE